MLPVPSIANWALEPLSEAANVAKEVESIPEIRDPEIPIEVAAYLVAVLPLQSASEAAAIPGIAPVDGVANQPASEKVT